MRSDGSVYFIPYLHINGIELYFPEMVTVWHTDPKAHAEIRCRGLWRFHFSHLSVEWPVWHDFLQKRVTRCAYCGDKSNPEKGKVNHRTGNVVCHGKCLDLFIRSLHDHDPQLCTVCVVKRLPALEPWMPYPQREFLDSLRIEVSLGIVREEVAAKAYYRRKRSKEGEKWL